MASAQQEPIPSVAELEGLTTTTPPHRNIFQRLRSMFGEEFAEFWGTFMIVFFGAAAECQAGLYRGAGDWLTRILGWAVGVSLGIYLAAPISGGHVNPTVTISMSVLRGFPASKAARYVLAQILGAFLATLVVYLNYRGAITAFEGSGARTVIGPHSTAGRFFTIPHPKVGLFTAYVNEFVATAALVALFLAFTDERNVATSIPFAFFILILGIGASYGIQTGFAINPALTLLGYGKAVWTHDKGYWLWVPWLSVVPGGIVGGLLYDLWVYNGQASIFSHGSSRAIAL
ncbi:aquaporin-like protein [Violaceomyces palustris]|uniref:Aquaporin-like protein n=1 Tax=Violaceomyces palustris TaxID=1673888 RepID=A0ACD0P2S3_9BASI|nr:aquaporin-like protein [Violaceomyces palustris]